MKGRRDVVVFDAFLVERFLPTERRARRDGCPIGVSVGGHVGGECIPDIFLSSRRTLWTWPVTLTPRVGRKRKERKKRKKKGEKAKTPACVTGVHVDCCILGRFRHGDWPASQLAPAARVV